MSKADFNRFYGNLVSEHGLYLKSLRDNAIRILLWSIFLITVTMIFFILGIFFYAKSINMFLFFFIIFFICIIFIIIISTKVKKNSIEHAQAFESIFIRSILNFFAKNIQYDYSSGIDEDVYKDADFFECYNTFYSSPLFKVALDKSNIFKIAHIVAKEFHYSYEHRSYDKKVFYGLFIMSEMFTPSDFVLYLRKDIEDKSLLYKLSHVTPSYDASNIRLNSEEFEKIYDLYATDKDIALRLFSPSVVQLLIDFYNETGIECEFTIKKKSIYIRFCTPKISYLNPLHNNLLDRNFVFKYFDIFYSSFEIFNKLNENL